MYWICYEILVGEEIRSLQCKIYEKESTEKIKHGRGGGNELRTTYLNSVSDLLFSVTNQLVPLLTYQCGHVPLFINVIQLMWKRRKEI